MVEDKILVNSETGEEFTYEEIEDKYEQLKREGMTDAETIGDYVENLIAPNGPCEWIDEIYHKCQWCGEIFPESDLREEKDLGYLCEHCILAISSRGEDLYLKY